ncbi:hypothetical protein JD844_013847 [Phrynosoma platyrhinos]|uniref:Uncharacterized protein n=1 Tax=Phrynosoma platyrhinos TaxID=52577 RepID=A0ABQ7TLS8_PHRPL|nr:hypothetical protein JD844_013847 [Phrynosoma platyrhinos]
MVTFPADGSQSSYSKNGPWLPDVTVKVKQEDEPCDLWVSEASSKTSSGFPDIIIKQEKEEELCFLDHQGFDENANIFDQQSGEGAESS